MKRPLRLLVYCTIGLALCSGLFFALRSTQGFKGEEEAGEEGEDIPGVLISMNAWSESRTYPYKTMPERDYSESYEQASRMSIAARAAESKMFSTTTAPWSNLAPMNFSGRIILQTQILCGPAPRQVAYGRPLTAEQAQQTALTGLM
jgi:hypothetical protein